MKEEWRMEEELEAEEDGAEKVTKKWREKKKVKDGKGEEAN